MIKRYYEVQVRHCTEKNWTTELTEGDEISARCAAIRIKTDHVLSDTRVVIIDVAYESRNDEDLRR